MNSDDDAYDELCAYTLTRGDVEFVHQLVVDARTAQQANATTKPIGIFFALVGLYLHVEHGWTGRQVQRARPTAGAVAGRAATQRARGDHGERRPGGPRRPRARRRDLPMGGLRVGRVHRKPRERAGAARAARGALTFHRLLDSVAALTATTNGDVIHHPAARARSTGERHGETPPAR
jgi:hypothetical protein